MITYYQENFKNGTLEVCKNFSQEIIAQYKNTELWFCDHCILLALNATETSIVSGTIRVTIYRNTLWPREISTERYRMPHAAKIISEKPDQNNKNKNILPDYYQWLEIFFLPG